MNELQRIFEGLCADLGYDAQSSDEAARIWEAMRAANELLQFEQLARLADQLSRTVIANEVQPGPGYDSKVWELALCVREELALLEPRPRLPPIAPEMYTMRDALWYLE